MIHLPCNTKAIVLSVISSAPSFKHFGTQQNSQRKPDRMKWMLCTVFSKCTGYRNSKIEHLWACRKGKRKLLPQKKAAAHTVEAFGQLSAMEDLPLRALATPVALRTRRGRQNKT